MKWQILVEGVCTKSKWSDIHIYLFWVTLLIIIINVIKGFSDFVGARFEYYNKLGEGAYSKVYKIKRIADQ